MAHQEAHRVDHLRREGLDEREVAVAVWGGDAPDPDLGLPDPSGAGSLFEVARRPWAGQAVACDPHAGRVAVATPTGVMIGILPDLGRGRQLPIGGVRQLVFVPGRRRLVLVGEGGVDVVWLDRPGARGPEMSLRTPGDVRAAVSPGGRFLALAGRVARPRASVGVWDLDSGVRVFTRSPFDPAAPAWVSGEVLAVAGREMRLLTYLGQPVSVAATPRGEPIEDAAAAPGGIITAGRGPLATLWGAAGPTAVSTMPIPAGAGRALSVDGQTLAAGTVRAGGAVALVDTSRSVVDRVLLGMRAAAVAGEWVVATGRAGTVAFRFAR